MKTKEFQDKLELAPQNASLLFHYFSGNDTKTVKAGYHVTEIKSARIETMDCGGKGNRWAETTLQLWAPDNDDGYMSVEKFLDIYKRVSSSVTIADDAEMRVEYGDIGSAAISYVVSDINISKNTVNVSLFAPAVACKAADASVGDIPTVGNTASCCSPAEVTQPNIQTELTVVNKCC